MSKDLRDAIKKLNTPNNDGFSKACKVDSVDLSTLTCYCLPLNDDADIPNVRLMANANNGFLLIPEVDSIVIVSFLDSSSAFVSMVSKVSEVNLNGKNFDGLVKVQELTDKLNNLEGLVNDLLTALQGVVIPLAPSGTYPFAPLFGSYTPLIPTQQTEIENPTIKQGDGN